MHQLFQLLSRWLMGKHIKCGITSAPPWEKNGRMGKKVVTSLWALSQVSYLVLGAAGL